MQRENLERDGSGTGLTCLIPDLQVDLQASVLDPGINLDLVDPDRRGGLQFDSTDNAVPISLGMIGDAMGVDSHVDHQAVIDPDYEEVLACRPTGSKIIHMGSGKATVGADELTIDPNSGLPMRTF